MFWNRKKRLQGSDESSLLKLCLVWSSLARLLFRFSRLKMWRFWNWKIWKMYIRYMKTFYYHDNINIFTTWLLNCQQVASYLSDDHDTKHLCCGLLRELCIRDDIALKAVGCVLFTSRLLVKTFPPKAASAAAAAAAASLILPLDLPCARPPISLPRFPPSPRYCPPFTPASPNNRFIAIPN